MRIGDNAIGRASRRLGTDLSGSIAVEGAFAFIAVLAIMLPLLDFGSYIGIRLELKQALRAGGQYALEDYTDTAAITSTIRNAASLKNSTVGVAIDPTFCLCNDGTTEGCVGEAGFALCADGVVAGRFMTIRASATFDPLFAFFPWFSENQTVTEQLTMRVR